MHCSTTGRLPPASTCYPESCSVISPCFHALQHNLKVPFGQLPGDTPPELQTDYGLTGYGSGTGLGPEAASKRTPLLGYQRLQLYEYKGKSQLSLPAFGILHW
eukprot:scaffold80134_cov21-Tisochrysis_lutea.AAC.3